MHKLSNQNISVNVPGKVILIGEHSVVYGQSALAMPLNDVRLTLNLLPEEQNTWNDVWKIQMQGKPLALSEHFKNLLTQSLTLAMHLFGHALTEFKPQTFFIDSQIPLGGGMGGSAAVSASLIKLCSLLFNQPLILEKEIDFANQIDSLFHSGRASGLDVTTILSAQLIQFKKGTPFKPIKYNCSFYIALIDSAERAQTSSMIQKVAIAMENGDKNTKDAMQNIGSLALECESDLTKGDLYRFAENLNKAQNALNKLNVSTPTLDALCKKLLNHGALCAKLTGAGGGGLVLGIFDKNPEFLSNLYSENIFITKYDSNIL